MSIPQNVKDIIDIIGAVGTPLAILGALVGAWRFSIKAGIAGHDRSKEASQAVAQINELATNHFPHMQKALEATVSAVEDGNKKTDKAIEVLGDMKTSLGILVDRTPRHIAPIHEA
jgi:hypothetical protein